MNFNYIHTITLYHKNGREWIRQVFDKCYFKHISKDVENDTSIEINDDWIVRIPHSCDVKTGDLIVLGVCNEEITRKSPNTLTEIHNRTESFLVREVSKNTSHMFLNARHTKVVG